MTGPEHYTAAQRYLDEARTHEGSERERTCLAYAQVHAMLAQTAASAQAGGPIFNDEGEYVVGGMTEPQEQAWASVLDAGSE